MKLPILLVTVAMLAVVVEPGFAQTLQQESEYQHDSPSNHIRQKAKLFSFAQAAPRDCKLHVDFVGEEQRFAELRYGTEGSTQVLIAVDWLSADRQDFDLYVDLNRDRAIVEDEKVSGSGRAREFSLPVEIVFGGLPDGGLPEHRDRQLLFRTSLKGARFSIKTVGGYLSRSQFGNQKFDVWRMDSDANGLYADAEDELWIDLDRDGEWNPISERFLFCSAIKVNDQRFAVRADQVGEKIEFVEIEGEGELHLDLGTVDGAVITSLRASLFGDDGSAHSVADTEKIILPVGKYMVGQISLRLEDGKKRPWEFSFAHSGKLTNKCWVDVTRAGVVVMEPFAGMELGIKSADKCAAGEKLSVRPTVKTESNLYITGSIGGQRKRLGRETDNPATVTVMDSGQRQIVSETSGFA